MKKLKVLFVSQEITPYVAETHMGTIGRFLPQGTQERGREIRTFMPRYGCVNERRNQLHEVIRLSGMNIIVDDSDHPLIIKVASIQQSRMQVYFIDNEEYFQRKAILKDGDGNYFEDNDERSVFFCRGVIETVRKLGWQPDIIHCNGWFTAPMAILVKKVYKDDPLFAESKVIYNVYDDEFSPSLNKRYAQKIQMTGIEDSDLKTIKDPTYLNVQKFAIDNSDAIIQGSEKINSDVSKYIKKSGKTFLEYKNNDEYLDAYSAFYDSILEGVTELV
jgi:starch synthase